LKDRCGSETAISLREDLEASSAVRILWVELGDETSAWRIFKTHRDKAYSFTDCTSFALMEKHAIKNAFAYDRHFAQYGLNKLP